MKHINKYFIVAVFEFVEDSFYFWGTGFIVENKLYSAAHVFDNKKGTGKFYFKFKNEYMPLHTVIYREYYGDGINLEEYPGASPHKDLIIFEIDDLGSPYKFFTGEYSWTEIACSFGYSFEEKTSKVQQNFCYVFLKQHAYYHHSSHLVILHNCMDLRMIQNEEIIGNPLTPGNSGSPVIDENNTIYGMFIGSGDWYELSIEAYKAIRSTYIMSLQKKDGN